MKKIKMIMVLYLLAGAGGLKAQDDTLKLSYRKPLFDFEETKPTIKTENDAYKNKNRFFRYALLSGYKEGVEPILGQHNNNFISYNDTLTGNYVNIMFNLSKLEMCTHGLVVKSRILLEVKDPSTFDYKLVYGSKIEWLRKYGYCYELSLPFGAAMSIDAMNRNIANDLNVKFGYEDRLVKTWVLSKTKDAAQNNTVSTKPVEFSIFELENAFYNAGLPYLVNETGQSKLVGVSVNPEKTKDLISLNLKLKPYGYEIKEEMKTLNLFIIKEVKSQ